MIQIVFALRILGFNAAKEKLEIVKSRAEAAPNSRGVARRNAFGLIQEYCTKRSEEAGNKIWEILCEDLKRLPAILNL